MISKIIAVITAVGTIALPKECITSAREGLMLCFNIIIPSLFPFIICAKIIIKSGLAKRMGDFFEPVMRPLFNVPGCGSFPFIIGILSGYPLGAKCAVDLYEKNLCTKAEAERLICFCNNSGPLFIIGSAGVAVLGSKTLGLLLYLSHILSALTVGIIFRFYKKNEKSTPKNRLYIDYCGKDIFPSSVKESVDLIMYICGFVVFFSVFLRLLTSFIKINSPLTKGIIYGFFEMANGINHIGMINNTSLKLILMSAVISFGGISVLMQVSGVLSGCDLSRKIFIFAKALQALFASFYTLILLNIPAVKLPVFAPASVTSPVPPLYYSLLLLALFVTIFLILSVISRLVKIVNKL